MTSVNSFASSVLEVVPIRKHTEVEERVMRSVIYTSQVWMRCQALCAAVVDEFGVQQVCFAARGKAHPLEAATAMLEAVRQFVDVFAAPLHDEVRTAAVRLNFWLICV